MTSAYDLPSVQTLGKGEGERGKGVREQPVGEGICYSWGEICISITPVVSAVNHMAARTFTERRERERKKRFFPLNFNIYIYLDNRTSKVFLLISKKSVLLVQSCCCCFFLLISKKKVCCTCKVVFLLIRSIVVAFYRSRCLHLVFSITRFYIFFKETINIKESFAFSSGLINILKE